MSSEALLLQAIHNDPRDLTAWPVLADWLEEQGDPRSELLRLWCALRDEPRHRDRRQREDRLAALLKAGVRPCVPLLTNSVGMTFVLVPPGRFVMGAARSEKGSTDDEWPAHEVEITRPFYLGVHLVTQAQYHRVVRRRPSAFRGRAAADQGITDTDDFPVDNVSWQDCAAFCKKLSAVRAERQAGREYRLPTEAEWEYACRAAGAVTAPFHLGHHLGSTEANFDGNQPFGKAGKGPALGRPSRVGSYPPNALGLHDMHGNLWEWCADWYDEGYYAKSPRQDPTGPKKTGARVLRGGCYNAPGYYTRAADRGSIPPDGRASIYGFRVAFSAGSGPFTCAPPPDGPGRTPATGPHTPRRGRRPSPRPGG